MTAALLDSLAQPRFNTKVEMHLQIANQGETMSEDLKQEMFVDKHMSGTDHRWVFRTWENVHGNNEQLFFSQKKTEM